MKLLRTGSKAVGSTMARVGVVEPLFLLFYIASFIALRLVTPLAWACSYRRADPDKDGSTDDDRLFVPIRCWPRTTNGKRIWWAALPFLVLGVLGLVSALGYLPTL